MARKLSKEEKMTNLRVFIGVVLTLTFTGIVTAIMYMMVYHPITTTVDQKYLDTLNPIVIFLTGMLSGVMVNSKHEPEVVQDDKGRSSGVEEPKSN